MEQKFFTCVQVMYMYIHVHKRSYYNNDVNNANVQVCISCILTVIIIH